MDTQRPINRSNLLKLATQVVSAFVANNAVPLVDVTRLITETFKALESLSAGTTEIHAAELKPAVPVKKSITPDFIICLDDGKKFKSLKRHLAQLGMTPGEYREKWGLPESYPMVAPNYSAARSSLAKSSGLGQKRAVKPTVSGKRNKKTMSEA